VLAYLFAFPLRPVVAEGFATIGLRVPDVGGGAVALGAAGITAASAVAAWVEFLLLRRGVRRRIGAIDSLAGYYAKLWVASLLAGAGAVAADRFGGAALAQRLPMTYIVEAAIACTAFGIIYFIVAAVLGVPEVKATLSRFRR
jgi:putative peptidoglycan lipid II flippase